MCGLVLVKFHLQKQVVSAGLAPKIHQPSSRIEGPGAGGFQRNLEMDGNVKYLYFKVLT